MILTDADFVDMKLTQVLCTFACEFACKRGSKLQPLTWAAAESRFRRCVHECGAHARSCWVHES